MKNLIFSKLDVISWMFFYLIILIIFFILFTQEEAFFVRIFDLIIIGFSFNQFLEYLDEWKLYNKIKL